MTVGSQMLVISKYKGAAASTPPPHFPLCANMHYAATLISASEAYYDLIDKL